MPTNVNAEAFRKMETKAVTSAYQALYTPSPS
jgi:hypothetical protein